VIGRISPEGKRAIVETLRESGHYVAMVGDGVNDVPALKASRLAIAQGTGAQIAKGVADLVLIEGDFAAVPELVHQGRQALRNLQRVARLYLTRSSFAAFLILTIGTSSTAYPLLPRHLTIAATVTIGIPTFFLALAPSTGPWNPAGFARRAARFAVPAGMIVGMGVVASYLFALHNLGYTVREARVIATTVLVIAGLYLVYGIERGSLRRRTAVGTMCLVLLGVYVTAILLPPTRHFFDLVVPGPGMVITAVAGALLAILALLLAGFPAPSSQSPSEPARAPAEPAPFLAGAEADPRTEAAGAHTGQGGIQRLQGSGTRAAEQRPGSILPSASARPRSRPSRHSDRQSTTGTPGSMIVGYGSASTPRAAHESPEPRHLDAATSRYRSTSRAWRWPLAHGQIRDPSSPRSQSTPSAAMPPIR